MDMPDTQSIQTFGFDRRPLDLRFRTTTLVDREWLSPDYIRVRVQGEDLVGFGAGAGVDDHVRIFFTDGSATTIEEMRDAPSREFTPLFWGEDWLDFEFAVHGDVGVAGVWAATAPLGAPLGVGGPRGSIHLDGTPQSWFLTGDETAIAQIRRYAAAMPSDATGRILIEVADAEREVAVDAPAGVEIEYVHRAGAAPTAALIERLESLTDAERPAGDVFAFIAAEQAIVKAGRALLQRWGVDVARAVVKGYWKGDESGTTYHAPH